MLAEDIVNDNIVWSSMNISLSFFGWNIKANLLLVFPDRLVYSTQ